MLDILEKLDSDKTQFVRNAFYLCGIISWSPRRRLLQNLGKRAIDVKN